MFNKGAKSRMGRARRRAQSPLYGGMITKLILPVAGLGTRLRPLTLTTPKNLIPVAGRPLLEYALDEAQEAGIKDVVLVVSPEQRGKYEAYLYAARQKYPGLDFHLRIQEKPWGHGHAVLQAADVVRGEPFLARFCDDIIVGGRPVLRGLTEIFAEYASPVMLLERVAESELGRYGVVKAEEIRSYPRLYRIFDFVEKPRPEEAPSNLAVIGGYALPPQVITALERLEKSMRPENDALLITDPIVEMLRAAASNRVYGWEFDGRRLDCGTLKGLEEAEKYLKSMKVQLP